MHLTKSTKPISEKTIDRKWHLIDVSGKVLGKVSPGIAYFLMGKNKTNYSAHLDMGDYVVVINAKKVVLTGKKANTKVYSRFSGYPGGLKKISFEQMINENPNQVFRHAVSGMLPKNKLRDPRLARLYVYADEKHPFQNKFTNK